MTSEGLKCPQGCYYTRKGVIIPVRVTISQLGYHAPNNVQMRQQSANAWRHKPRRWHMHHKGKGGWGGCVGYYLLKGWHCLGRGGLGWCGLADLPWQYY